MMGARKTIRRFNQGWNHFIVFLAPNKTQLKPLGFVEHTFIPCASRVAVWKRFLFPRLLAEIDWHTVLQEFYEWHLPSDEVPPGAVRSHCTLQWLRTTSSIERTSCPSVWRSGMISPAVSKLHCRRVLLFTEDRRGRGSPVMWVSAARGSWLNLALWISFINNWSRVLLQIQISSWWCKQTLGDPRSVHISHCLSNALLRKVQWFHVHARFIGLKTVDWIFFFGIFRPQGTNNWLTILSYPPWSSYQPRTSMIICS